MSICVLYFAFFYFLIYAHHNSARGFTTEDAFDLWFDVGQFDFAIDEAVEVR